ncbi:MAG: type I DNA topoisomerase [Chitinophagaceae bacterium]|nr:type I DNA topoisomerase [Chitinophagaceae bacterium]
MAKNLLIVESPAKAKTIEKILGSDFQVKSCFGHIRDLEKDEMGIDIKNDFRPSYIVSEDKIKVVNELKQLAKQSEDIWLASDEDREGEAISWHLCEVLGLDPLKTKRIVFHEITKPAIQKAVANPRTVNMDLVNAQQARRILDRIVGFELSPVLWRKISRSNSLSAGRVQSVAVRLIVEREREINAFQAASTYKIDALFNAKDINQRDVAFKAEYASKLETKKNAEEFLSKCIGASYTVEDIQVKPGKKTPSAPFTTSTLQQEASRKIGYSVSRTMQIAQKLYEAGHITYMRTDAVNLSETALQNIREEIVSSFGERYHQHRAFKNKNENAQEAHEAIRPTNMQARAVGDPDLQRLYDLIWKRTMACQMADAELEKTIAKINISTQPEKLTASGEVIKFDGFLKLYMESKDDDENEENEEGMLPLLAVGQSLDLKTLTAIERFSRPQPRYTEASLVKKLEELGIGRPSTYAPTISTIQNRNYVVRKDKDGVQRSYVILALEGNQVTEKSASENTGAEKSKLFPTDLGMVVTDFLKQHFTQVMDYKFTANIEDEFDHIAQGKKEWSKMLHEFYTPFHSLVETTMENAGRASGERELGIEPSSGKRVIARIGRFGPMIQIGETDSEEKPRFATLRSTQSIETITLDEALELFKLPMVLGMYQDKEVSVNIGRFGPYVKFGEAFISLPKGEEPLSVSLDRAIEVIEAKNIEDAPIGYYDQKPITKGKGRFGPFIKWNDLFINIPRAYHFDTINEKECFELIEKKLEKEANRYILNFPEEKISVENGRWGPFLRFQKKMLKLKHKDVQGKITAEDAAQFTLTDLKEMIVEQVPNAFKASTKTKAAASAKPGVTKKAASKSGTTKSAAAKSSTAKKNALQRKIERQNRLEREK